MYYLEPLYKVKKCNRIGMKLWTVCLVNPPQSNGHDCTIRVVWCDRAYDPIQLNWTKLAKCSESVKLIKTSRVQLSRIVDVITPADPTQPNSLVESHRLVWSRLRSDSTKQFSWVESDRLVWSLLRSDSTKQFSWVESDRLVWSRLNRLG